MTFGIWLPAALFAGLLQAWRTALQQRLRGTLSVSGAGLVRYLYGAPVALLLAVIWFGATGTPVPALSGDYLLLAAAAGLAQILGTALLILSFGYRGFVVGTAFSKTEALLAALGGWVALSERLPSLTWAGIAAGVAGVFLLSLSGKSRSVKTVLQDLTQPAALCGLGTAALFAVTGLLVRAATGRLGLADPIAAALVTLLVVTVFQTLIHGGWVAWREPRTLRAVVATWRQSGQVGLLATLGSACWFTGFATAPVALVRIVGQVEVAFTIAFAHFHLRERAAWREIVALLLIALGVVLALAGGSR